jgi:carboxylesterase
MKLSNDNGKGLKTMFSKKAVIYSVIAVIILVLLVQIKIALEKPEIMHENGLDNNQDPNNINELNQGFTLDSGEEVGLLILHGLGASPYQTRDLANYLHENGVTISSIRLSGHGTTLKDLKSKEWEDWYEDTKVAYEELDQKTDKTYVLGISLGSSLALKLAQDQEIDGLVLIAPPIYLTSSKAKFAFLIKHIQKYHYFGVDETQIGYSYENLPIKTIAEFVGLISKTKSKLDKIDEDVLIIQSHKDALVKPESAKYVFDNIKSINKDILFLSSVGHSVIRTDDEDTKESIAERQNVFTKINEFIDNANRD